MGGSGTNASTSLSSISRTRKRKRRRSDEQVRKDPELAYLLLQAQRMAAIKTKFIALRKAA
jgi:hypothetical protein